MTRVASAEMDTQLEASFSHLTPSNMLESPGKWVVSG